MRISRAELAAIRQQSQNPTPELCATLTALGSFLLEKGDVTEALENLHQAEVIYGKLCDPSNMQLGDNLRLQANPLCATQSCRSRS